MDRKDIHNSEMPVVCRSCEARHRGICGALTPTQLTELNKATTQVDVKAGTRLLADQEPIERYGNILKGVVKLSKILEDGRQQIVGLQFAPDLLGQPFEETSDVDAEVATDAKLCVFSKAALERAVNGSHEMTKRLHAQSQRELHDAREWMITLGRKTAREKVASFLKLIVTSSDPEQDVADRGVEIDLPLNRGEMADFLGLTLETVSRQMTALRKNGIIDFSKSQHIIVLDLEALEVACGS